MYRDIKKEEEIKGVKFWRNPNNKFYVMMIHYSADPNKDPDRDGEEWFKKEKEGAPKVVWNKEYEIDFSTKAGQLVFGKEFCDFDPTVHFINSFELGRVEQILSLDFGQRNPNCALVAAITRDGTIYIIDEYYEPAIPSVATRNIFDKFGYLIPGYKEGLSKSQKRLLADNAFQVKVIDPSTSAKNRTKIIEGEEIPYSVIEDFYDNGLDFERGNNDWEAGITRIREYMRIRDDGTTNLYIFADKCPNLCWELTHYRYQENTEKLDRKHNAPERPVKKNDHAVDSLRYLITTRPNVPERVPKKLTRIQKDIKNLLMPQTDKLMDSFDAE